MTNYRAVVRHVRYWRGQIHRWSTSWEFTGSGTTPDATACSTLLTADSKMCAMTTSGTGGTYECEIYNTDTGGSPIASFIKFNWEDPASWVPDPSTGPWGSGLIEPVAEVALLVEWQAGVSRTGKPVRFRKYFHAVRPSIATGTGTADISSTLQTALQTQAQLTAQCLAPTYGLVMGNARRIAGTVATVSGLYVTHQMPRGRRRKPLVTASGKYTGPTLNIPGFPGLPVTEDN